MTITSSSDVLDLSRFQGGASVFLQPTSLSMGIDPMSDHIWRPSFTAAAIGLALCFGDPAAFAQSTYQATDLSFPGNFGTSATAISGGQAAGHEIYSIYYLRHAPHYQLHAIYWPAGGSPVDLNPSGSSYSEATGVSGTQQSGYASIFVSGYYHSHALVWQGSPNNATDLSMPGYADTYADGISGTQVVGQGTGTATGGYTHAVLWDLAHGTIVDLNGTNHQESGAVAASGSTQVGWANDATGANQHAMLWQGTAASAVDLNPSSAVTSQAYGVNGSQQVGITMTASSAHAILWSGSAASAVDLNPAGYTYSYATGIGAGKQVGYGTQSNYKYHALVWSGSAQQYVDLHNFLPSTFAQSYANGVDANGNIVGYATDTSGVNHAILWRPVH
jgi:probable HAF family extracellular repeat protein